MNRALSRIFSAGESTVYENECCETEQLYNAERNKFATKIAKVCYDRLYLGSLGELYHTHFCVRWS